MRLAWMLACMALGTAQAADEFASFPAVYENLEIEQRLAANGGIEETRRACVRIQSETGAQWANQILVPLRREDAEVQISSARAGESGTERDLDAAQLQELPRNGSLFRVYAVPGLHSGDRICSEVRVRYPAAEQAKWWANLAPVFDLPVIAGQWTVRFPETSEIDFDLWHTADHRETQPGVHVWQLAHMAAQANPAPWFGLSTFNSWSEVGDWLRGRPAAADSAWLREQARNLLAKDAKADVLGALYTGVAQGVNLLDEPLAASGFRAATPRQTLTASEGNAFSKHALLAALLETQSIPCDLAFVAASPFDVEFPSPGQFERVIAAVPKAGGWTWLDASWGVARPDALPPELRGRSALLVSDHGSRIAQIPAAPAGLNWARATWKGELQPSGTAYAKLRVEVKGDAEVALRQAFLLGAAAGPVRTLLPRASRYESGVARALIGAYDLRGPLAIEMPQTVRNMLPTITRRGSANFHTLNYGPDCQCSTPGQPALLNPPLRGEESFELRLPPEIRPILPPAVERKLPAGSIEASTTAEDNVLRIRRTIERRAVSNADPESLDTAIAFDSQRDQVFERTGTIDVDSALKNKEEWELDREGYDATQGDVPLARVILEYATKKFPGTKYSWNNLVYERYGMWDEALRAYNRQIEVNPKDQWAYENRGKLLSATKRDREAIDWFQRQLAIDPEDSEALRDLGHSYVELGNWAEAEPYLSHALQLQPQSWEVMEDQGLTKACRGDVEGAKQQFLRVYQYCPQAATSIAWELANCGAALDYARFIAQGALSSDGEAFDATRELADWPTAVAAQQVLAATLAAIGRVQLRMKQFQPAADALRTAAMLVADEDLLVGLRDAAIALGDLPGAAQAQVDAQALAGERSIEVPAAIAQAVERAKPMIDADGWKRLTLGPAAEVRAMPERQLLLACTVSPAGVAQACTLLDPDTALQERAARDAARAAFPRVNWRGKDEPVTRLIRLTYHSDSVEAHEAVSVQATRNIGLLMPSHPTKQERGEDSDDE
ncbi:MAG: tetratricopeptide repeat protein [Bryobacteraceae bacterium]